MRLGIIVVMCGLAACGADNGTYFVVDGARSGITFDRLEFFFGKEMPGQTLVTPERLLMPTPLLINEPQRLTKRTFAASDVQDTPETDSLTYFLPPDPENTHAHYAIIVAWRGDDQVGLAEVEYYNVFDDGAYLYDVALVPLDSGFERWGSSEASKDTCVRWTRQRNGAPRASTYAVLRDGDLDCDGQATGKECDDLSYCDPEEQSRCTSRVIPCLSAAGCDLGRCIDPSPGSGELLCELETCLPDAFCATESDCHDGRSVDEFIRCALRDLEDEMVPHTEVRMHVKDNGGLCRHAVPVVPPNGLECQNPRIEWPAFGVMDDWTFRVEKPTMTIGCLYTLEGPSLDARPPDKAHLVVSVETFPGGMRTSFVIGFAPQMNAASCSNAGFEIVLPVGTPKPTCP